MKGAAVVVVVVVFLTSISVRLGVLDLT